MFSCLAIFRIEGCLNSQYPLTVFLESPQVNPALVDAVMDLRGALLLQKIEDVIRANMNLIISRTKETK